MIQRIHAAHEMHVCPTAATAQEHGITLAKHTLPCRSLSGCGPATRLHTSSGFTLIEVMVAVTVVTFGALGIFSLGNATIKGNAFAREMTIATDVTRSWVERLRADAMLWRTAGPGGLAFTTYLRDAPPVAAVGAPGEWIAPTPPEGVSESFAYDYHGFPTAVTENVRYCTHLRYEWVFPGEALRVSVRTYWHRTSRGTDDTISNRALFPNCGRGAEAAVTDNIAQTVAGGVSQLHAVHSSIIVRRGRP